MRPEWYDSNQLRAEELTPNRLQNGLKRRMVDGVEGGTQVEKNESRDLTGVNGTYDVVMNCSDCCFSGVELSVSRLMRWKKMIGLGVCCEALDSKFFNDLGDEAKVGYRSVGFKFERVDRLRFRFLSSGLTIACFCELGKIPCVKDELTMAAMVGARVP